MSHILFSFIATECTTFISSGQSDHYPLISNRYPLIFNRYPLIFNRYPLIFNRYPLIFNRYPLISNRYPLIFNRYPLIFNRYPLIFNRYPLKSNQYNSYIQYITNSCAIYPDITQFMSNLGHHFPGRTLHHCTWCAPYRFLHV